jgi:glyoxylase-like metal-dependent hydrolase (beta-lactamase superfamily II)
MFLLTEGDGSILIDAGTGIGTRKAHRALEELLKGSRFMGTALTHEHFDHSGGAKGISERFGGDVWCSEACSRIISGSDNMMTGSFLFGEDFQAIGKASVVGDHLKAGPIELVVHHTPGHSQGSVCYFHEDTGSLFCGDLVFCDGGIGRYDLPGGDFNVLRSSVRSLLQLPVRALYPGHGRIETGDPMAEIRMSASVIDL